MGPQRLAVAHLIKFCNSDPVFVRLDVLCSDVQRDLAQIKIWSNTGGGSDASGFQHIQNDFHGKFPGRKLIHRKIIGDIHKHLIDGVNMDVLRSDIFEINLVDLCADFDIMRHLRWGDVVVNR